MIITLGNDNKWRQAYIFISDKRNDMAYKLIRVYQVIGQSTQLYDKLRQKNIESQKNK